MGNSPRDCFPRWAENGIAFSEHYSGEGAIFYAFGLGCEGIVSKRLGSPYHAGCAGYW